jgi:hypothetical protein
MCVLCVMIVSHVWVVCVILCVCELCVCGVCVSVFVRMLCVWCV